MITDKAIDQAFSDWKQICGGVRNDYFGLLYLEQEFSVPDERAITQVAFGGNDYGIDGFHFDRETRNLYLFQSKCSESHTQFKGSFVQPIEDGMERIFGATGQDQHLNQLLQQIKSSLIEMKPSSTGSSFTSSSWETLKKPIEARCSISSERIWKIKNT